MTFSQSVTKIGDKSIFSLSLISGIDDFAEVVTHAKGWVAKVFEHEFAVGTFSYTGCTKKHYVSSNLIWH